MTQSYVFSNAWERERERLAIIERSHDPGTLRILEECGVGPGWRCLEVGGGGGSVAAWLCERVSPKGSVLATDIDTRWLDQLRFPNLEVRRHDIVATSLESDAFDLIHARLVLEHLPPYREVLAKLLAVLRRGGWLVVEDFDWISVVADEPWVEFEAVRDAVQKIMKVAGYDREFGRKLPRLIREMRLADVQTAISARGDQRMNRLAWRYGIEQFRSHLSAAGLIEDATIDAFLAELEDADGRTPLPPIMVSVWGRKDVAGE